MGEGQSGATARSWTEGRVLSSSRLRSRGGQENGRQEPESKNLEISSTNKTNSTSKQQKNDDDAFIGLGDNETKRVQANDTDDVLGLSMSSSPSSSLPSSLSAVASSSLPPATLKETPGVSTSRSSQAKSPKGGVVKGGGNKTKREGGNRDGSLGALQEECVGNDCAVCYEGEKDTLIAPCGHTCLCLKCATQLLIKGHHCPVCR
jgi:hypothetical protein